MLKLNKKKTQNRLIAQFFDDRDSSYLNNVFLLLFSQVVGVKDICYPFEDYYNDYKANKGIDASFILRAKRVCISCFFSHVQDSELSRLDRCRLRYRFIAL